MVLRLRVPSGPCREPLRTRPPPLPPSHRPFPPITSFGSWRRWLGLLPYVRCSAVASDPDFWQGRAADRAQMCWPLRSGLGEVPKPLAGLHPPPFPSAVGVERLLPARLPDPSPAGWQHPVGDPLLPSEQLFPLASCRAPFAGARVYSPGKSEDNTSNTSHGAFGGVPSAPSAPGLGVFRHRC